MPPASVATTGTPAASASITTTGAPSLADVKQEDVERGVERRQVVPVAENAHAVGDSELLGQCFGGFPVLAVADEHE